MLFKFMICSVLIGAVFSAPVSGPDTYELVPGAKLEGDDQKAHSIPPRVNVQGREYGFDVAGLKPHATAGQDPSDHRVFRYQFQQHEPMVDRMVYYQYEAKHRDNVKFVTANDVSSCSMVTNGNHTTAKMTVSHHMAEEMAVDKVVVLAEGCQTASGKKATFHGKVLAKSITSEAHAVKELTLTTSHAAPHEVFEYSHLEYYHGKTENLKHARDAWLTSLKKFGYNKPTTNNFAETEAIVKAAKASPHWAGPAMPKALGTGKADSASHDMARLRKPAGQSRSQSFSPQDFASLDSVPVPLMPLHSRQHGNRSVHSMKNVRDLNNLRLRGLNCNAMGTPQGGSCWWNSGDRMTLNEQARYVFTWDYPDKEQGNYDVYIDFIEDDTIGNDNCKWEFLNPSGQHFKLYDGYAIINMPSWDYLVSEGCADGDAMGTFPEFFFRFYVRSGDDIGKLPGNLGFGSSTMRLMTQRPFSFDKTLDASFSFGNTTQLGGVDITWLIQCDPCDLTVSGDAHVIARTGQYNPFEEAWSWGNLSIVGQIDFLVSLTAEYSYEKELELIEALCVAPLCIGGKLAGVAVELGIIFGLKSLFTFDFTAELKLTYNRMLSMPGNFTMHNILDVGDEFLFSADLDGMEPVMTDTEGNEPEAPSVTLEVEATATVSLIPSISVGLFAGIGGEQSFLALSAEAGATVYPVVTAVAHFLYRIGAGSGKNFSIPALPDGDGCSPLAFDPDGDDWGPTCCGSVIPACTSACLVDHHLEFDILLTGRITLELAMSASVKFGFWGKQFNYTRYLTTSGIVDEECQGEEGDYGDDRCSLFYWNLHLASLCMQPLSSTAAHYTSTSSMNGPTTTPSLAAPAATGKEAHAVASLSTRPFYGSFTWETQPAYTKMNGDCYGMDLKTYQVSGASECEVHCTDQNFGCKGFSLSSDGKTCILKDGSCTSPTSSSWTFYQKNGDGSGEQQEGICSCIGPDDQWMAECKLAACFNRAYYAGYHKTGQNFGFGGICEEIKAGPSSSSLSDVDCDAKYGVTESASCINRDFRGMGTTTGTCMCDAGDDNIATSPCCLSGCLNQKGWTANMRNAGARWGWSYACDSANGPYVAGCDCQAIYYDVIGYGCDEIDSDPNPYLWKKCYSVDAPLTTLASSKTAEECYANCAQGGFKTCAYQFNGCFGAMGPASARSGCGSGNWQYAATVWEECASVDAPYTALSASSGAACYDACYKNGFATCAWQTNGCYGSNAEEPATRSSCIGSAVQVDPQMPAIQWKDCYSVDSPYTTFSPVTSSGYSCYNACIEGDVKFCAWQYNGCFGSNASMSERNTDACENGSWVYAIDISDLVGALKDGSEVHLMNMYSTASYLDVCGTPASCGAHAMFAVSTNYDPDRANVKTGTWVIERVDGSGALMAGDEIYLKSAYAGTREYSGQTYSDSYLDVCLTATCSTGTLYNVITSAEKRRDGDSGTWIVEKKNGASGPIMPNDEIHLKNKFGAGSYLDSCGYNIEGGCTAANQARYDVSTNTMKDRCNGCGTATWKLIAA